MRFTTLAASALTAAPSPPQTAHLTFLDRSAAALYQLAVVADNRTYATPPSLPVARIAAPDYNAAALCDLVFAQPAAAPEHVFVIGEDGRTGQVRIEPPTPVAGIRCAGVCVANYGTCNGADGRGPRLCCNGYCAANLCRPWNGV
ncbi:hypothetical protein A9K55_008943 [Cordyceps militaris]|uniref:Uncharacterized protein n=1 Tax=Cordyceps militaris TaxID=73501 RepID=A0A2H4SGF0_CORMI|nr:hypothetical protein A9K55_008943 [Cordyceps militaris]